MSPTPAASTSTRASHSAILSPCREASPASRPTPAAPSRRSLPERHRGRRMTRPLSTGTPDHPGVTLEGDGVNVAVFSAHAERIELCLFDADGGTEQERIALPERTGDVFHGHLAGVPAGTRYGLRAHGPYDPPRWPSLQPREAADRPPCPCPRQAVPPGIGDVRLHARRYGRRPVAQRHRQRLRHAQRHRRRARRQTGVLGSHRLGRYYHLRIARARLLQAQPGGRSRTARHVRGAGLARLDRPSRQARRHLGPK